MRSARVFAPRVLCFGVPRQLPVVQLLLYSCPIFIFDTGYNFEHIFTDIHMKAGCMCWAQSAHAGSVCKLRLSVCRLDVLNVQFVDCTRHKPGLQTGIQFANCVHPVLVDNEKFVSGCNGHDCTKRTRSRWSPWPSTPRRVRRVRRLRRARRVRRARVHSLATAATARRRAARARCCSPCCSSSAHRPPRGTWKRRLPCARLRAKRHLQLGAAVPTGVHGRFWTWVGGW